MALKPEEPLNPGFDRGRGGPPKTMGARVSTVARDLIQQIADGGKNLWRQVLGTQAQRPLTEAGGEVISAPNPPYGPGQSLFGQVQQAHWRELGVRREPFFGPGRPMRPVAPKADVAGRAWDFPTNYNMQTVPRQATGIGFDQLRRLADFDMIRLAIETRKDQMGKLEFSILPRKRQKDELRAKPTDECRQIEEFLRYPDKRHSWDTWLRLLLEDHFVLDAPTIYVRRTGGGDVWGLEVVDGSTIVPKLDLTGRMPLPPEVAYQQIIKGMPVADYTADEMLYLPRNPRPGKVYGMSPVEQIIVTVNIAMLRETAKLNYYTEGNIPEALCSVPKEWTPQQISEFQAMWDALMNDNAARRRMKFVPGDMAVQFTRDNASLMDTYDEWLARVICYAFSLPALPFIRMQNRATAETAYETAIEEGLQPMMLWVKGLMDRIVQQVFRRPDLEFVWDDIEKVSKAERDAANRADMQLGIIGLDEVRAERGLPPLGMKPAFFGIGPHGIIPVEDLVKAQQQGLLGIQPPMPAYGMPGDPGFIDGEVMPEEGMGMGVPPGAEPPALAAPRSGTLAPGVSEILAGVDPRLLAAVGLGPEGPAARAVDVTDREEREDDPLAPHVAHPAIIDLLRSVERRHQQRK